MPGADRRSAAAPGALALGVAVVLTLAGLTLLQVDLVREQQAGTLPVLAVVGFAAGAVLLLVELANRATVMVAVATSASAPLTGSGRSAAGPGRCTGPACRWPT